MALTFVTESSVEILDKGKCSGIRQNSFFPIEGILANPTQQHPLPLHKNKQVPMIGYRIIVRRISTRTHPTKKTHRSHWPRCVSIF